MTLDHPDQFFSAAGDSLCFHSDGGSDSTVPCTLDLQTVVCTVDLRTCSNFEMAPSDFPDLMKSVMCSFRSNAELFRLSYCSGCD